MNERSLVGASGSGATLAQGFGAYAQAIGALLRRYASPDGVDCLAQVLAGQCDVERPTRGAIGKRGDGDAACAEPRLERVLQRAGGVLRTGEHFKVNVGQTVERQPCPTARGRQRVDEREPLLLGHRCTDGQERDRRGLELAQRERETARSAVGRRSDRERLGLETAVAASISGGQSVGPGPCASERLGQLEHLQQALADVGDRTQHARQPIVGLDFEPVTLVAIVLLGQIERNRLGTHVAIDETTLATIAVAVRHPHLLAEVDLAGTVGGHKVGGEAIEFILRGLARRSNHLGFCKHRGRVACLHLQVAIDLGAAARAGLPAGLRELGVGARLHLIGGKHQARRCRARTRGDLVADVGGDGGSHVGKNGRIATDVERALRNQRIHRDRLRSAHLADDRVDGLREQVFRLPAHRVVGKEHPHRDAA